MIEAAERASEITGFGPFRRFNRNQEWPNAVGQVGNPRLSPGSGALVLSSATLTRPPAAPPGPPRRRGLLGRIGRRRGLVAAAVVLNQLAYGSVYSWSILSAGLQSPHSTFALGRDEAGLPFATAHALVFVGTVLGGLLMSRRPPRGIALVAGVLYAGGLLLAGCADGRGDFWLCCSATA